ncbi:MAG: AAA family ATPase [Balneolaceae bacterium]|nr:AAA family ATPase [Balneolaceae bacterium]
MQNFRNHIDTEVEWTPHLNVIVGPNGAGKTNLIDAIHYLCMSRSFVASSDRYVVNQDSNFFMIKGHFEGNIRSSFDVGCSYSAGEGKKIFVNESPLDRLSDLIGMVPVVVLAPEDKKLTSEGPTERRSFIDSFISQISPNYLRDLMDFRKVRKQRNKLLSGISR